MELKQTTEQERKKIKEAFEKGVEQARYKKKIPEMIEEERIRKENKKIAKDCGIQWF